jgi:hypothetical protein
MKQFLAAALMAMAVRAEQLQVTVYDKARLSQEVRETAFDDLRRIFRESRIDVQIVTGDLAVEEAALWMDPGRGRGTQLEAACRARRDITLAIIAAAPPGLRSAVLGMAQPLAREGINVRIFDDHVRAVAARQSSPYAAVLAHAIAHEIGHVLLRSNSHSGRGIMSGVWTEREYEWMAKAFMSFSAEHSLEMRANLSGSQCSNADALTSGLNPAQ